MTKPKSEPAFKIEKGIPIPPSAGRPKKKYPFEEMEVNDSFFEAGQNARSRMKSRSNTYAARTGKEFEARTVIEKDENGIDVKGGRIWRVK